MVSATSLRHRDQRNKGHAISVEAKVSKEPAIAEESATAKEPRAMAEIEMVENDDPPQSEVTSASLMNPGESGDAIGFTKHYDASSEDP